MSSSRLIAVAVASSMVIAAVLLVVDRGGLLAWSGAVLGALLLLKVLLRPSPRDVLLSVATLGVWAVSWGAAWAYVVSTWESGEVVQIEVAGGDIARVWVLDTSDGPLMYYEAPPDVANRLLAGAPLSMTRNGQVQNECANASRVEELPEEQVQDLLSQLEEKYEGRNTATAVFYAVLGVQRDRVGMLIRLAPCS